jgi:DNA-binding NarL/FixJ family response regulator
MFSIRVLSISRNQIEIAGLETVVKHSPSPMEWLGGFQPEVGVSREIQRLKPHVVIFDDHHTAFLPELRNLFVQQNIGLLLLSHKDDWKTMAHQIQIGVFGVFHIGEPAATLIEAIHAIAKPTDEIPANRRDCLLTRALQTHSLTKADQDKYHIQSLTPRERHLVGLVLQHPEAKSLTLSEWMGISESALRNALSRIYHKLNLHGRAALVKFAQYHHLD